jgi:hypothetical protein
MPHFLRVQKSALHVPSISNVIMETSCLGRGRLRIYFHNTTKPTTLSYSNQETWWSDYKRIKEAMQEVSELLAKLPLTEQTEVKANVEAHSKEIEIEVPKSEMA